MRKIFKTLVAVASAGAAFLVSFASINGETQPESARKLVRGKAPKVHVMKGGAREVAELPENVAIGGQVVYKAGGTGAEIGFYRLPNQTGDEMKMLGYTPYRLEYGGYFDERAGIYRGVFSSSAAASACSIVSYNSDTWEVVEKTDLTGDEATMMKATSMAMNAASGEVYGFFYNESGDKTVWAKADFTNNTRQPIKEFSLYEAFSALACTSAGEFYGIDLNATLMHIDAATGEVTEIGQTDLPIEYQFGACINNENNTMLATCNTEDYGSGLYEINLADGETRLIADFGEDIQVMNLFVMPGASSAKAPASPQLSIEAPKGSMTANYTLTLPTKLADGTAATGEMGWKIETPEKTLAEGKGMAGGKITGSVTLENVGRTDFFATATNSDGSSARVRTTLFIGKDTPAAPNNVTLSYGNGKLTLTWEAVTTSANGGYVDPEAIRYNVSAKGSRVATGLTAPHWELEIDEPENRTDFSYEVEAEYDGKVSEATQSNVVSMGHYVAPFETVFNSTKVFEEIGYTVLDANGDRKTWTSTAKGARYQFNKNADADDWLFTPAIKLEKGKVYNLTLQVTANSVNSPETFEVKAGREATTEAMTVDVIGRTVTNADPNGEADVVSGYFMAAETGSYHIGIHAISEKDMWYLFVRELQLSAPVAGEMPMAVDELTVSPDVTGELTSTISFTAPQKTVTEKPLDGKVTVSVSRNGTTVKTVDVTPGEKVSFNDAVETAGDYTYTVKAIVNGFESEEKKVTVYVGPYPAETPEGVTITELETPGKVTLSWKAVTTDINGTDQSGKITYMVYAPDEQGLMTPMLDAETTETSVTFTAIEEGKSQNFVYYGVTARNRGAESDIAVSAIEAVGKPYELPVVYSSAKSLENYRLAVDKSGGASWGFMADADGVESADGDGQFFASTSYFANKWADLISGKIDLKGGEKMELVFHTYKHDETDMNSVEAFVRKAGEMTPLAQAEHSGLAEGRWTSVYAPLDEYAGECIQIVIRANHVSHANTLVDHIEVRRTPEVDMELSAFEAPATVGVNEKFTLSAEVASHGYRDIDNAKITLYRDNEPVESITLPTMKRGESTTVEFTASMGHFDEATEVVFRAEVEANNDGYPADNKSKELTVERIVNTLPVVDGLSATCTDNRVTLRWNEYAYEEKEASEMTEDFENGNSFAHEFKGWKFVDVDKLPVGGMDGVSLPGITAGKTLSSFFVFDDSAAGMPSNVKAHSGNKYLATLYQYDGLKIDDWAISPRLSGEAQSVSLYARSLTAQYPETIEIWYTTVEWSEKPEDYVMATDPGTVAVPEKWTKITAELPAGTRHFAIRSCGEDSFMLMVDDVTYTPDPDNDQPAHVGYNVYRDGKAINSEPLKVGAINDMGEGVHTYHVTNVFATGESELSEPLTIDVASLGYVTGNKAFNATGSIGEIKVMNPEGERFTITTADGKRIAVSDRRDARIATAPGVYVVTTANITVKVAVK